MKARFLIMALVAGAALPTCSPRESRPDVDAVVLGLVSRARSAVSLPRPSLAPTPEWDDYPPTVPGAGWPTPVPTALPEATPSVPSVSLPGLGAEGGAGSSYAPPVGAPSTYSPPVAPPRGVSGQVPLAKPFQAQASWAGCRVRPACERFFGRMESYAPRTEADRTETDQAGAASCAAIPDVESCPAVRYLDCAGQALSLFLVSTAAGGTEGFGEFCRSMRTCLVDFAASGAAVPARELTCEF